MQELERLFRQPTLFREVNFKLLKGSNIVVQDIRFYHFVEEYINELKLFYELLGYRLIMEQGKGYCYLEAMSANAPKGRFSRAETFVGMFLGFKFLESGLVETEFIVKNLFQELFQLLNFNDLYTALVKGTKGTSRATQIKNTTIQQRFCTAIKNLAKYGFLIIVDEGKMDFLETRIKLLPSLERFYNLAKRLVTLSEEDAKKGLLVYLEECGFELEESPEAEEEEEVSSEEIIEEI